MPEGSAAPRPNRMIGFPPHSKGASKSTEYRELVTVLLLQAASRGTTAMESCCSPSRSPCSFPFNPIMDVMSLLEGLRGTKPDRPAHGRWSVMVSETVGSKSVGRLLGILVGGAQRYQQALASSSPPPKCRQ